MEYMNHPGFIAFTAKPTPKDETEAGNDEEISSAVEDSNRNSSTDNE